MLLSVVSVLVVAQSSSVIPEGLMNNPVFPWLPMTLADAVRTQNVHTPVKERTVIAIVGRGSVEVHATSFEKWGYPK